MTSIELKTEVGEYELTEENFFWKIIPKTELKISRTTIAVPHDGLRYQDLINILPVRKDGIKGRDRNIWSLAKDISSYSVVNLFRGLIPRHFLDYNRYLFKEDFFLESNDLYEETEEACEDDSLRIFHHLYHESMVETVLESKRIYKEETIFFDFHGFSKQPPYGNYDIILGTANSRTVKSEIDLILFEKLRGMGYSVFLPKKDVVLFGEVDYYDAAFTTRNVFLKTGVDSIQIELNSSIRCNREMFFKFTKDFASII